MSICRSLMVILPDGALDLIEIGGHLPLAGKLAVNLVLLVRPAGQLRRFCTGHCRSHDESGITRYRGT
ncbi:hypothetical protein [Candidatus Puniceispirillum sp.]|uniref:hypothetical protein n=1 Tax=Candidatus Puniceispirillum sp. TaxID=2026719 RepID=UPI003F6A2CF2